MYRVRKKKHSWYNARCAEAKKIRDAAWKRWRRQREARNDNVRIRREEEIQLEKDIVNKCKDEPKLFYGLKAR